MIPITTYFQDLAMNMDSHKKEVHKAAAEVLGLCLKLLGNDDDKLQNVVLNIIRDQLQKLKKTGKGHKNVFSFMLAPFPFVSNPGIFAPRK